MEQNEYEMHLVGEILLTQDGRKYLNQIAKWTKFLSILGFVLLGISLLIIVSLGIFITATNRYEMMVGAGYYNPAVFQWSYVIVYVLLIAVYFVPLYYLYQFSVKTRQALQANNTETLTEGLAFLKKHYMFIGVFVIICLVMYLLGTILMIAGFARM